MRGRTCVSVSVDDREDVLDGVGRVVSPQVLQSRYIGALDLREVVFASLDHSYTKDHVVSGSAKSLAARQRHYTEGRQGRYLQDDLLEERFNLVLKPLLLPRREADVAPALIRDIWRKHKMAHRQSKITNRLAWW
jgi:hypothetical protein